MLFRKSVSSGQKSTLSLLFTTTSLSDTQTQLADPYCVVLPVVKISSLGKTSVSSGKLIHGSAHKSIAGLMGSTYINVGTPCRQHSTDGLLDMKFEAMQ